MVIKQFEFNMLPVNTYIIFDKESKDAAIIDAGCYFKDECDTLKQYIQENNLHIKYLLNTHLHFDHIFGNRFIYKEFGIKTYAHRADEDWLTHAPQYTRMFGLEFPGEPVPIGTYLDEGDILSLGRYTISPIHIPGHSPGSLVLYIPEIGVLFSGDVLFQGSIGRPDLPGGDHKTLIQGIRSKLMNLPKKTVIYPGHGPSTTIEQEKKWNSYLKD